MKKRIWLSLLLLVAILPGCKTEELLRVEKVVGEYNFGATCTIYDLLQVNDPLTLASDGILYVTRPREDEDGFIALLDDEVYLEDDLSFKKSLVNYSIEGEFDGGAGLMVTTDIVDLDANTRTICAYTCTRR